MNVKMIIQTFKEGEEGTHRSEIWSGELDIKDKTEYLMLVSVIAEGQPHPICQVPFAIGIGHYLWIPPDDDMESPK